MKEGKKAAFKFLEYQIPEFSFKEPSNTNVETLDIRFEAQGNYDLTESIYSMQILFLSSTKEDGEVTRVLTIAKFSFEEKGMPLDDIPPYFYRNGLAIVFPFIRAFISTLTLQANLKLLIIPILNLSELEEELKSKTVLENS